MRSIYSLLLLCTFAGLAGCAQHDLFHPGSISSGVAASHLIKRVWPAYPAIAREQHISGAVVLSIDIDEEGNAANVIAISGPQLLLPSAIDAVKQWKYRPFQEEDGTPVAMHTIITLTPSFGG